MPVGARRAAAQHRGDVAGQAAGLPVGVLGGRRTQGAVAGGQVRDGGAVAEGPHAVGALYRQELIDDDPA
ncbi:MAG: hypothetical protein ACRDPD_03080, partial [Streptosporangiaceae bacterium]